MEERATEALVPALTALERDCESARPADTASLRVCESASPVDTASLRVCESANPALVAPERLCESARPTLVAALAVLDIAFDSEPASLAAKLNPAFSIAPTKLSAQLMLPLASTVVVDPSGNTTVEPTPAVDGADRVCDIL